MPGRWGCAPGERRGGRQKGTPNKATADIKRLAQNFAPKAMKELLRLAEKAESETVRVMAIKEVLDRGYGKAHQSADVAVFDVDPNEMSDVELARIAARGRSRSSPTAAESPPEPSGMVH
jgi:hypothetical protein